MDILGVVSGVLAAIGGFSAAMYAGIFWGDQNPSYSTPSDKETFAVIVISIALSVVCFTYSHLIIIALMK